MSKNKYIYDPKHDTIDQHVADLTEVEASVKKVLHFGNIVQVVYDMVEPICKYEKATMIEYPKDIWDAIYYKVYSIKNI